MGVRNGYWLVGRAGRWLGGLKAVRAGARRGEAAPVVCGGSGVSSGGWYPMPGREYTGAGRGAADRQGGGPLHRFGSVHCAV